MHSCLFIIFVFKLEILMIIAFVVKCRRYFNVAADEGRTCLN